MPYRLKWGPPMPQACGSHTPSPQMRLRPGAAASRGPRPPRAELAHLIPHAELDRVRAALHALHDTHREARATMRRAELVALRGQRRNAARLQQDPCDLHLLWDEAQPK